MDKRNIINGSNSFNGLSPGMSEHSDLVAALSGMSLLGNGVVEEENHPVSVFNKRLMIIRIFFIGKLIKTVLNNTLT